MLRVTKLLTLLIALSFFACTEPDLNEEVNQEAILTSGSWNIFLFFDDQGDKAADFANYTFNFKSGGIVTATKSSTDSNGTWKIAVVTQSSKRMTLDFTGTPFESLDNEWIIQEITSQSIELVKFTENGTENLHFTKM